MLSPNPPFSRFVKQYWLSKRCLSTYSLNESQHKDVLPCHKQWKTYYEEMHWYQGYRNTYFEEMPNLIPIPHAGYLNHYMRLWQKGLWNSVTSFAPKARYKGFPLPWH